MTSSLFHQLFLNSYMNQCQSPRRFCRTCQTTLNLELWKMTLWQFLLQFYSHFVLHQALKIKVSGDANTSFHFYSTVSSKNPSLSFTDFKSWFFLWLFDYLRSTPCNSFQHSSSQFTFFTFSGRIKIGIPLKHEGENVNSFVDLLYLLADFAKFILLTFFLLCSYISSLNWSWKADSLLLYII